MIGINGNSVHKHPDTRVTSSLTPSSQHTNITNQPLMLYAFLKHFIHSTQMVKKIKIKHEVE